jgi:hypothetical protein
MLGSAAVFLLALLAILTFAAGTAGQIDGVS